MLSRQIGARAIIELLSLLLIVAGFLFGVIALFGIRTHGKSGILAPAIVGIIINGLLLFIFVTNFLAARSRAQQQRATLYRQSPLMTNRQELPFRASPEALEHIRQSSHPRPSLRATLMFAQSDLEFDDDGAVQARFDGEHLLVGYLKPRQVVRWPRLEIGGHLIAVCPDTLARLDGKKLTLRKKAGHGRVSPYVLVVG